MARRKVSRPDPPTDIETMAAEGTREVPLEPLPAAAGLALLLDRERPAVVVLVGQGLLTAPALAAARETGTRLAHFGKIRGAREGDPDLGDDPAGALDRLTGVAREIS